MGMERPQNMVQLQIMGKDTIFCKGEETEENHYTQKINMLKKDRTNRRNENKCLCRQLVTFWGEIHEKAKLRLNMEGTHAKGQKRLQNKTQS